MYCYIPESYFKSESDGGSLQIVDLPGFGENDKDKREKADRIIDTLSQFSAGTIIVVKSESIQSLQSEYKRFISSHHHNHLAIAVSHALATNQKLGKELEKQKDDDKIADDIIQYYSKKIIDEKYVDIDKEYISEITFPVERGKFLVTNYNEYCCTAFEIVRSKLKSRIKSMQNSSSIQACIEMLEKEIERCNDEISNSKEKQKAIQEKAEKIEDKQDKNNKNLRDVKLKMKSCEKEKVSATNSLDAINELIRTFKNNPAPLLSTMEVSDFWKDKDIKESLHEDRNEKLCEKMKKTVDAIFAKINCPDNDLLSKCSKSAKEEVYKASFEEMMTGTGLFRSHGSKWELKVSSTSLQLSHNIFEKIIRICDEYRTTTLAKIEVKIKEAKACELELIMRQKACKNILEKYNSENEELKKHIKLNVCRVNDLESRKNNVKSVFVKHFKSKNEELIRRIDEAKSPEEKIALFLVLSSIYINIKQYIEEKS